MKYLLLSIKIILFQFLLLTSVSLFGQCNIDALTAEVSACEGDLFDITVDFEYENTSDQFTVVINNVDFGTYNYEDLPVTVTSIESDCLTEYVIVVTDSVDDDCSEDVLLPVICCEETCEIFDLVLTTSECENAIFDLTISFDFVWGTSTTFDWEVPGVASGSAYLNQIPLTVQISNANNDILGFVVNMTGNSDCAAETSFENPCVDPTCFIGELIIEESECDGNLFFVEINFEYENTSDEFFVNANGENYGPFLYTSLPVTIDGLESNCDVPYEFLVYDSESNGTCESDANIGIVCCDEGECEILSIDFGPNPVCIEGFIVTEWYIFAENTSEVGFDIFINNEFLLFVEYNPDNVYDFDIPDPETEFFTIKACDNDNPDCCYTWELENPCFEPEDCFIGELNVEVSECDGNQFFVVINFEYENTSDEFTVAGNGNSYGTFAYADLPITIDGLESDCDLNFEFVVIDSENDDCASDVGIGEVCCEDEPCDLFDLVIETSECDGGVFMVTFDFEYTGTTNNFFDWEIPGYSSGFAEFSDLPLTLTIQNTNALVYELLINENDNPDCSIAGEFENPCFEPEDCFIGELDVEVSECDGNQFFVVINFEYENTSDEFTVAGNGNSYGTFAYADLPITIDGLESDCDLNFEFVVIDSENDDCASDVGIGEVCCDEGECEILSIDFGPNPECVDGFIVTEWYIFAENTSEVGFDIFINNEFLLFVEYNPDNVYDFDIPDSETEFFTIKACDNDNPDCCYTWELENPCFEPEDCFIGELDVEVSECDGNQFFVVIDFEYENTSDEFTVAGNGNSYGTFAYADLPITIDGLESDCDLNFEFVVIDSENDDCASDVGIGEVCCEDEPCDLFDLVIETSECDGGVFMVTFDFEYTGTTNNFFDWEIPGYSSGFAEFSDLPLTLTIQNTNALVYELLINENDNPDCSIAGEFENPCFEPEDCFIGELDVEVSECDGNQFFVVIDFEYENTSDEFTVAGNGNSYGTFAYADLPITIDGLESDCDLNFEFVVIDSENDDCASDVGIGEVCCEDEPCDLFDLVIETSECDGGVFMVTFDFEYTGTTNEFFNWEIPGINSGTAAFEDLPVTISIENVDSGVFVLEINENDNSDCSIVGEFENPCVEDGECFIGELNVEVSECDGNFFFVVIDFEYENTSDQFTVAGNGTNYGTFAYGDLPITIDGIESNCDIQYEFVVYDANNDDCLNEAVIGAVCCEDGECDLSELDFDVSDCENGSFSIVVDFEYEGNTEESFVWEIPGIGSGTSLFSDLPITIEIESTTDAQFTFFANEIENPDCSIVGTFGNPCFDGEECWIDGVSALVIACEEDLFDVEIDFEYDNVGTSFSIVGNGVEYGSFSYDDLPIVLTGLAANCELEYEFVISDNDNEQCSDFVELGTICCEDFNQINDIESETIIIDGVAFKITFDIGNTTLKGCQIEVYVGGELYTTLESSASIFEIGPFDCGQDDILEILLINTCSEDELSFTVDLSDIECVSNVEEELLDVDFHWNMFQKVLSIEGENALDLDVQILNAQGALVISQMSIQTGWSTNLETLPAGLYFVRMVDSNSISRKGLIKKIVVY
ncbi:MAG: T9SS type A sorting domain-containing protein [Saprospiraceae bacterium]|nr:T9SS type A sorting domain-containing protein [Saprospiraceae bacterium]